MRRRRVAIVGGGFSGTLAAIHCAARGLDPVLIERAPRVARGIAYATPRPEHLLNVRAGAMGAFPDRPGEFAERTGLDPDTFAPRAHYGDYLERLFAEARAAVTVIRDQAVAVERAAGEAVRLASGERVEADAAILAIGNLPPALPPSLAALPAGIVAADPWRGDLAAGLGPGDAVLLVGTGLTAVDAILTLDGSGFQGSVTAISRRGLVPRAHAAPAPMQALGRVPEPRCTALLSSVRAAAREVGWRAAVDALRPVTQQLWAAAPPGERRRFLRHLRPWWDVHRHRIAPEVAERLEELERGGRLRVAAGKLVGAEASGKGAAVLWRPRGSGETRRLDVARIVNCTGPELDIARSGDPLLVALLAAGRARSDACAIGIDVDPLCRVRGADGTASDSLFAVGPITRGAFWESVAVPDIRVQVAALAERLR